MAMTTKRTHKIALIPGDGIGPEVSGSVVSILEAAGAATGVAFDWHRYDAGAEAFDKTGEYIPQVLYDSIEKNKVALKGPVTTPIGGGFASINVTLRKKVELFANFPPVKNLPGLKPRDPGLDLIIVGPDIADRCAWVEQCLVSAVG